MQVCFSKYQGTGNDFILINNIDGAHDGLNLSQVGFLCDRKFGIGSDGLILINKSEDYDFAMVFYNPDGSQSFCGNGARCAVQFAGSEGLLSSSSVSFEGCDGVHQAELCGVDVKLQMSFLKAPMPIDPKKQDIQPYKEAYFMDTGAPHFGVFVSDLKHLQSEHVLVFGKKIRFGAPYAHSGVNVNLIYVDRPGQLRIATYEKGVEYETLSCGTGATACALIYAATESLPNDSVSIHTKGGMLRVSFDTKADGTFSQVYLIGPAILIYEGKISI